MKRLFFLIISFIFFIQTFLAPAFAELEPTKVMSLHYDDSSALVYITTKDNLTDSTESQIEYKRLSNPNRIYFDINNAVLIGEKQQLIFEKSEIKEIRLAQFETNPNNIVRTVITFEEDFDTSKIKLISIDGNIVITGEFNTFIDIIGQIFQKENNKATEILNDKIEQLDLIYIFRALHPKKTE